MEGLVRLLGTVSLMVVVAGCGTAGQSQVSRSSPSPAAATPSGVASRLPAGWVTYTEPAWGYSISMPADWHLVTAGQINPPQVKSFSSDAVTNVVTLAGLSANGMQLNVIVSQLNSGCPGDQPPVGWSESTVPAVAVSIDGYQSVVWGSKAQSGQSWSIGATSSSGKYCYSFVGVTLSHDAQVRWTPLFEQMLSTFTFGTPKAPPF